MKKRTAANSALSHLTTHVFKTIVALCAKHGATTVAEFVEDEDTEFCLRRLGVHRVQGYLYGALRPLADVLAETAAEAAASRE